jgi:hypothetical protein
MLCEENANESPQPRFAIPSSGERPGGFRQGQRSVLFLLETTVHRF